MPLYLVRHGKAEAGDDDVKRRLTRGGRKAVARLARTLAAENLTVRRIEHSGLVRAEETATILADALDAPVVQVEDLLPTDNVVTTARRLGSEDDVMLVGHLPFMERLISLLITGDADTSLVHMATGTVACLTHSGESWILEWLMPPSLMGGKS